MEFLYVLLWVWNSFDTKIGPPKTKGLGNTALHSSWYPSDISKSILEAGTTLVLSHYLLTSLLRYFPPFCLLSFFHGSLFQILVYFNHLLRIFLLYNLLIVSTLKIISLSFKYIHRDFNTSFSLPYLFFVFLNYFRYNLLVSSLGVQNRVINFSVHWSIIIHFIQLLLQLLLLVVVVVVVVVVIIIIIIMVIVYENYVIVNETHKILRDFGIQRLDLVLVKMEKSTLTSCEFCRLNSS